MIFSDSYRSYKLNLDFFIKLLIFQIIDNFIKLEDLLNKFSIWTKNSDLIKISIVLIACIIDYFIEINQ